ncbi:MAG: histidine kinase [Clostridia bacterium]|nr:histidine kinase [Clostridia bacterium]MDY5553940.1 histidine kinase [Blautia sp.]
MKHHKLTMRNTLLCFCIASVILALLLQTFLFHQSLRMQIRTEIVSDHELSLNKMQTDIGSFIQNIRGEMLSIYSEQDLIASLRNSAENGSSLKDYYWSSWYFSRKRFTKDDQLLAMYLYDTQDNLVSAYRYNSYTFPRNIYNTEYDSNSDRVLRYVHSDKTELMISGYYNPNAKKNIIRFVLKLHNYDEKRDNIGYLICDINSAAFTSIMKKYVDVDQVCLWLQPIDDQVIAITGQASDSQRHIQKQLSKIVENYYSPDKLKQEYEGNYLIQVSQENYNLEAFVLVSQSLLTAAQKSLIHTLLVIMAAMIFTLVVLVFFLSRWMTKPVEEMRNSIVRIKNGETSLRVQPVGWSEELTILGNEFNEMLDRIQAMAQEELQHKMLVERTEYKMLQAQINPHFLYNTLDTMSGIANAQNCPLVSGLCHSLSAIFRYSLNMTDELSTVQNEMAHVRNYLYVMDVRNGASISYIYQIDSDTLQDSLPRICLQPVVENAITHGLRNVRRKDKKLLIRSEHINENLVITIEDNGIGMDADEMNRLLEINDLKRVETGVSIGILNVNARLKKIFGKEYGIKIQSDPGEGTTVTITVPAISGEKNTSE